MPKRTHNPPPTDDEIMAYNNVPLALAAKYIGWSSSTVANALKQGRAPFGFAAENKVTHTFSYNISPGLLVKYKSGNLATYPLREIIKLFGILAGEFQAENARIGRPAEDPVD